MIMILRSLAPFILFAVLAPLSTQLAGAAAALVLTLVLLSIAWRRGSSADQLIIELSSLTFFAAYTVVCVLFPHGDQGRWTGAAIQLWLGITVIATLVLRKPFTLPIAKTRAPQQVWASAQFVRFNVVISSVWAASFLLSAVLLAVLVAAGHAPTLIVIAIMVLAIVLPVLYTNARVKQLSSATGPDQARS